jgi:ankyrin repeat protein
MLKRAANQTHTLYEENDAPRKRRNHLRERAFRAVHKNLPDTVHRLFGEGLEPDLASERGLTLLGLALPKGDAWAGMVKVLLDHGALSCNDMKGDPLFFVPAGQPNVQRLVVEASSNLDVKDFTGATPLICAAKNKDAFLYDLLLQNGANPDLCDDFLKKAVAYL